MYIPSDTKMESIEDAHKFIDEYSFGIIITESLEGTHLPFILHRDEGEFGTLYGHCAKANHQSKKIGGKDVLVIFSGRMRIFLQPGMQSTRLLRPGIMLRFMFMGWVRF